ncbi:MAG: polyprenyl synthetase family protein [Pyrinomonadaceae bacterium]
MDEFGEFLERVRRDVEVTLEELIPKISVEPSSLHEAVRWSVFAGGKRVRPALVYASGAIFGADRRKLRRTAAAAEMIHTYSLVHDDLPAMDDDDLRRGRATCHKRFGEATAILTGDVLQTLAFQAIADDAEIDAQIRIRLISLFTAAAGTPGGMVSGQQMDLEGEGKELAGDQIKAIHSQKTGALIRASACAGAIIGGASASEIDAVDACASSLGLLFQVTDDILDATRATADLGKTAGKDATAKKATYVSCYGIDRARALAAELLAESTQSLDLIDRDTTILRNIAASIAERNH